MTDEDASSGERAPLNQGVSPYKVPESVPSETQPKIAGLWVARFNQGVMAAVVVCFLCMAVETIVFGGGWIATQVTNWYSTVIGVVCLVTLFGLYRQWQDFKRQFPKK